MTSTACRHAEALKSVKLFRCFAYARFVAVSGTRGKKGAAGVWRSESDSHFFLMKLYDN